MRIDLSCDQHQLTWDQLVERVQFAEDAGFTGAWVFDHFKALYGPPIWIGGGGERRLLPTAARRADVWHGFGAVEALARKSRLLDRLCEEAGRDPSSVARSTSPSLSDDNDLIHRRADALREAGSSILIADWPTEGRARVEEFVADVMPKL